MPPSHAWRVNIPTIIPSVVNRRGARRDTGHVFQRHIGRKITTHGFEHVLAQKVFRHCGDLSARQQNLTALTDSLRIRDDLPLWPLGQQGEIKAPNPAPDFATDRSRSLSRRLDRFHGLRAKMRHRLLSGHEPSSAVASAGHARFLPAGLAGRFMGRERPALSACCNAVLAGRVSGDCLPHRTVVGRRLIFADDGRTKALGYQGALLPIVHEMHGLIAQAWRAAS